MRNQSRVNLFAAELEAGSIVSVDPHELIEAESVSLIQSGVNHQIISIHPTLSGMLAVEIQGDKRLSIARSITSNRLWMAVDGPGLLLLEIKPLNHLHNERGF
jgi:hypothetical protein